MHKRTAVGALTALLLFPTGRVGNVELPGKAAADPIIPLTVVGGVIPRNSTISAALATALPAPDIHRLVDVARPVYDLARVSVGHPFQLATDPQGLLRAFTYGIDELSTLRIHDAAGELKAEILSRDYERRVTVVSGTIQSSLFLAVSEAWEEDQFALDLAEIFSSDVDFNTEIQPGDSFRVAVEKLSLDGVFKRNGNILAAEFVRSGQPFRAFRFEDGSGQAAYLAPDGKPQRKAFLRSPLRFTRISSGFSASRLHPVLGYRRAHPAIDFAAGRGTPVIAPSDGLVVQAGWMGGLGRAVRIRHNGGIETLYGHLSRVDVRRGERVVQGERIGAVGSTGLSTGPHLHYSMLKNGAYVNPLRAQLSEPMAARDIDRARFEAIARERMALLDEPSRIADRRTE